ncbi:MAG: hypothetical protein ABW082_06030 [Sedimenticola sp.]
MAKAKKKKKANNKDIKQYKKQVRAAEEKAKKLLKKIDRLDKKLAKRNEKIKDLKRQSEISAEEHEEQEAIPLDSIPDFATTNVSRDALRKAGFLRDRYEHHLGLNKSKRVARQDANRDLVENYGPESGFSVQELEDVLS